MVDYEQWKGHCRNLFVEDYDTKCIWRWWRGNDFEEEEESSRKESIDEGVKESKEEREMEAPPAGGSGAGGVPTRALRINSVLPDGVDSIVPSSAIELQNTGGKTPMLGESRSIRCSSTN